MRGLPLSRAGIYGIQPIAIILRSRIITARSFAAKIGMGYGTVNCVLRGDVSPTEEFVSKATKHLGLPASALFTENALRVRADETARARARAKARAKS